MKSREKDKKRGKRNQTGQKGLIAASILSADFSCLGAEIDEVERGGADTIHIDVMDGHFVPNLTIGPPVIRSIRKATRLPFDVHLMIDEPRRYLKAFREAGADWITVHVEACRDVRATLKDIRNLGAFAGVTLKPQTDVKEIMPFLPLIDLVLVMTVEPGFGGQRFMSDMLAKVRKLKECFPGLISVDGGIDPKTIRLAYQAGANVFVVGTGIFGFQNRRIQIDRLRESMG